MSDIRQWLDALGLGDYASAFERHAIGWDHLADLDHDVLKEIGVSTVGHRMTILKAVSELGSRSEPVGANGGKAGTEPAPASEAERRQLTVMFCDLVGSSALSQRMDPEELRDVIAAFQHAATAAIERYGGYIARYMGDGLLVYFGYPQAHEDDAERAVRAGLGIVEAIRMLAVQQPIELHVRVGIATGLVVAGDLLGEGSSEERAVLGDTPNLAARLQGVADPDCIVVSAATLELVDGLFEIETLTGLSLKGIPVPVTAFRIERESRVASRFEAAAARGLTPLVGRQSELVLLSARWEQARKGEGQVVLLSGDAGVGKSRIVRALADQVADAGYTRITLFGSPYHTNSAYFPIVEHLRRAFELETNEGIEPAVAKLSAAISQLGLGAEQHLPVLSSLLSVSARDSSSAPDLTPGELRQNTLATLKRLIDAQIAAGPLLLVVEDAHWLDASSQDFIDLIVEGSATSSILVLITYRSEFTPRWLGHAHMTVLTLNRLARSDTTALVRQVGGDADFSSTLIEEIVARTDGVPLFIEELTKTLAESGGGDAQSGAIPTSLQDSLMARLDQLADAKPVAQFAAVLGRKFSRAQLVSSSPFEETLVDSALQQLVASELVYSRGAKHDDRYEFKHALVCDAAYESLLKSTRRDYHARIARTIEQQFGVVTETEPEQLARHFTEADLPDQAIAYWHRAGKQSLDRSAIVEAIAALESGLQLIDSLAATHQRDHLELDFQLLLASAHRQRSMVSQDSRSAYQRAKELADTVGSIEQRFQSSFGLWSVHQHSGDLDAARRQSDELLQVADGQKDPGLTLEACHTAWTSRFVAEELDSVVALTERGLQLYDASRYRDHRYQFAHDPGTCALTMNAVTLMFLGFADKARQRASEALALAEQLDHPVSRTLTLGLCTNVFRLRGEVSVAESCIDTQLALCEQYGFPGQVPFGQIIKGWTMCARGDTVAGVELALQGVEAIRSFGIKTLAFPLCSLADAYRLSAQYEPGIEVVDEAITVVETVGEHRWEPELYRLKGEMLLCTNDTPGAQAAFERGVHIAREQGARWFELRSANSLAELWLNQHKPHAARELLAPVYAWYTEGFDTADLELAERLLARAS